jgi:hypothetical protein
MMEALNTKSLAMIFSLVLLTGIVSAAVPSWVQPGVTATYDLYAAYVNNGQYNSGVHSVVTMQVDSVSADGVTGTVQDYNTATGMTNTQQVTCLEGEAACLGRFWLDPQNPVQSIKGDGGVVYKQAGKTTYDYGGRTIDAAMLSYKMPNQGIDFHIIYDPQTGLILSNVLKYSNQEVYFNFNSISGVSGASNVDIANGAATADGADVIVDPPQDY